jgi:hypothetical protein
MKPVVLGMAQPYPGYSCEQVTIVASRILDTIVASGQTRHTMFFAPQLGIKSHTKIFSCVGIWNFCAIDEDWLL